MAALSLHACVDGGIPDTLGRLLYPQCQKSLGNKNGRVRVSLLLEMSWICWTLDNFILGCTRSFPRLIMPWEAQRAGAWDEHNQWSSNPAPRAPKQSWDPACYSWRGIFLQEPVWCLKQALGPLSEVRQWCTAPCHGASPPVFWHCQLWYHSMSSAPSARELEQSLPLHLAHAWQKTLPEEIPQGRMLGQCLDPLCPTILTPSWPPLVPLSHWRKEAPTTKAPCGFIQGNVHLCHQCHSTSHAFTEQLQNSGAIQDGGYQGLFVASALLSSLTHLFSNSCNGYWCLDSPALEKAQEREWHHSEQAGAGAALPYPHGSTKKHAMYSPAQYTTAQGDPIKLRTLWTWEKTHSHL